MHHCRVSKISDSRLKQCPLWRSERGAAKGKCPMACHCRLEKTTKQKPGPTVAANHTHSTLANTRSDWHPRIADGHKGEFPAYYESRAANFKNHLSDQSRHETACRHLPVVARDWPMIFDQQHALFPGRKLSRQAIGGSRKIPTRAVAEKLRRGPSTSRPAGASPPQPRASQRDPIASCTSRRHPPANRAVCEDSPPLRRWGGP